MSTVYITLRHPGLACPNCKRPRNLDIGISEENFSPSFDLYTLTQWHLESPRHCDRCLLLVVADGADGTAGIEAHRIRKQLK